jgi:hypothetical protein
MISIGEKETSRTLVEMKVMPQTKMVKIAARCPRSCFCDVIEGVLYHSWDSGILVITHIPQDGVPVSFQPQISRIGADFSFQPASIRITPRWRTAQVFAGKKT